MRSYCKQSKRSIRTSERSRRSAQNREKYLEFEATIDADDEAGTLTIKTTQPYANLMGQLSHPTMGIVDVEHTENFDNGTIGTGPYMIDSFNGVGVGYTLVANPNFRKKYLMIK